MHIIGFQTLHKFSRMLIQDRKQRMDIGKCAFVIRNIKNWNQLPAQLLGNFHFKPKTFIKDVRKAIINGVKGKE